MERVNNLVRLLGDEDLQGKHLASWEGSFYLTFLPAPFPILAGVVNYISRDGQEP